MTERLNLLMVCVDDLRPLLRCYGHPQMHTPNFDRLTARSVLFRRAYCQVPVCGASRASLFTGLRPTRERFVNFNAKVKLDAPDTVTLPEHLKQHGYYMVTSGKVFHDSNDRVDVWDKVLPWRSDKHPGPYNSKKANAAHERWKAKRKISPSDKSGRGPAFECVDIPDEAQVDGVVAKNLIEQLPVLAQNKQPFCMALGSVNVHLPFKAPKQYWDLYDPTEIDLSHLTEDVDPKLGHNWGELRTYGNVPQQGPLDDELARTLIHGYMAGVSYLDAQVGKLLDALDDNGLRDSTAIVFWVDHGFNLGEHGLWCKHCLYEPSVHVPLMFHMPGGVSGQVDGIVENIDIYPTVCDMLDVPKPEHLRGESLMPMLNDPTEPTKGFAASRFFQGESLRTDQFTYIEYKDDDTGDVVHRVLFDRHDDPRELNNLVDETDAMNRLQRQMYEVTRN